MSNLENELQDFGLSELEAKIYVELLKAGKCTILELSRNLNLNRSTTHLNVEKLIQLGLVTQLNIGSRRVVMAEPPEKLMVIIEAERWQTKKKEEGLGNLVFSIYESISEAKKSSNSYIKYYENKKEILRLYDNILESRQVKSIVDSMSTTLLFPDNKKKFRDAITRGLDLYDIHENNFRSEEYLQLSKRYPNYKVKFFPKGFKLQSLDYLVHDDNITLINVVEGEVFAIVINHPQMAENARMMFDIMWSFLPG